MRTGIAVLGAMVCIAAPLAAASHGVSPGAAQGVDLDSSHRVAGGGSASGSLLLTAPVGAEATVPILVYHYIRVDANPSDALGINLSVTPTLFAEQMALLQAEGGHAVTLAALISAMANHTPLPAHPVVLTFDDGYADFATTAEPILARYGLVATDYVVSGFLGRPGFMTAAQVKAMDAAGVVIGSHTVNHVDLAAVPPALAQAEIDAGKAALEALVGHPVLDFAYPYGGFSAAVVQQVQQAGFRDAVTTMGGDVQSLGGRFLLHRTHVGGSSQGLAFFAAAAGLAVPNDAQAAEAYLVALGALGQPAPIPAAASAWRVTLAGGGA